MNELLDKLLGSKALDQSESAEVFGAMFRGELAEAQIAAFLAAWRFVGEGPSELIAGALAMRQAAAKIAIPKEVRPLTDNCGTGGDGSHSFNISTAAAIVVASAGVKVAKHGNRSASSKCGSADLLFEAGFPAALGPDLAGTLLEKTGFTFFFAPNFHPVMKHVMPVRKRLGVRTIFNLLGPLANPIGPERQLIGVGHRHALRPMAEALHGLGVESALVVHSRDGLDEISPAAVTDGVHVSPAGLRDLEIDPKDFGVDASVEDLKGGDAAYNLTILETLLDGKKDAVFETVALNAGAVLWLSGRTPSHAEGFEMAKETLSNGTCKTYFIKWIAEAKALMKGAS